METAFQIFRCLYASRLPMKRLFISAALLMGSIPVISAEEFKPQGLPEPPVQAVPASTQVGAGSQSAALEQPISLIPESLPDPSQKPAPDGAAFKETEKKLKKAKEDISADALKNRIRFREVKNQALKDDGIQAEMEAAKSAGTDAEKKAALKRFYNRLFDRMLKIDATLKEEVEARRKSYVSRYDQKRVRAAGEATEFDLKNDH